MPASVAKAGSGLLAVCGSAEPAWPASWYLAHPRYQQLQLQLA